MKIAIITSGFLPVIDGVTVSGFERLKWLSRWGHEVQLFCPEYQALEAVYPDWQDYSGDILPGVKVINLPSRAFMGLDFERNIAWSAYPKLLSYLKQFQPDVIHVDEPERLFLTLLRIPGLDHAKKAGIPCLGFYRTNFLDYVEDYVPLPHPILGLITFGFKQLILRIYNAYDKTLVSSPITARKVKSMGIHNTEYANLLGFDADKFSPTLRQPHFFQNTYHLENIDHKVKIIFLGRLTPDKGWGFTLASFESMRNTMDWSKVVLLVAGDGPEQPHIQTSLAELNIHVHFLGRVPPEQVPALLANSDLHVTTSEKETRGLTIVEALASGIPVLAPNAGGVVENIQVGQNGLIFEPQNHQDFGDKLKQLVDSPDLRTEMGKVAVSSVQHLAWETTIANLVNIWDAEVKRT